MQYFVGFAIGVIVGAAIVYLITRMNKTEAEKLFSHVSLQALRANSVEFLRLAHETLASQTQAGAAELDTKKQLIDGTLSQMKEDLGKIQKSLTDFDMKRETGNTKLSADLEKYATQTARLQDTTDKLRLALASTKERGHWGERMAEDVLQAIDFVEGINYVKQARQDSSQTRPDYTISLPQDLKLNMDVKFPWENYQKYLAEQNEPAREAYKQQFLRNAKDRIKEVTTREYIDPSKGTVDYMLLFVPSESLYCFMNESDPKIMDQALRQRVVLCSPLTLYAMLAVIRQAVENFNLRSSDAKVLSLFGTFDRQWSEFKKSMDTVGKRIEQASEAYGSLASTRTWMLERPLAQIDQIRKERGIIEAPLAEEATAETIEPLPKASEE